MSNRKVESRKPSTRKVRAADGARPRKSARPNFRFVAGTTIFGAVASLFLLLVMLEGPGGAAQNADVAGSGGGVSVVEKTLQPRRIAGESGTRPEPVAEQQPDPKPQAVSPQQAALAPVTIPPANSEADAQPAAPPSPQAQPVISQQPAPPAAPVSQPEPKSKNAATPVLPWQQKTTVAGSASETRLASLPPETEARIQASLPSRSELRSWVKSNAREFVGGVDADGMPLYRFDVWLEAPSDLRAQVQRVSYAYLAPSAQPAEQSSSDAKSGFRVKFGAASCAEKATVTLTLIDGRERSATVDGCRILN